MTIEGTRMIGGPQPSARLRGVTRYGSGAHVAAAVHLDANEGLPPPRSLMDAMAPVWARVASRYPDAGEFEAQLAAGLGVAPEQVIVTCGGDEALQRICLATLEPGRRAMLPAPTFEMIPRYIRLSGAEMVDLPWEEGAFPTDAAIAAAAPDVGAVFVVTPNNPTGLAACEADLRRLSAAMPWAVIVVDLAYTEYADEDLTRVALSLPNAVIVRTLSKAWGLAGLRVGYAAGPAGVIDWLRVAGGPYPGNGPGMAMASRWLVEGEAAVRATVERVRRERTALCALLADLGARPLPSQANFVVARFDDAHGVADRLLARGISVRRFTSPRLRDALRITCPADDTVFELLIAGLIASVATARVRGEKS
jgi:histidinol-phosphate aminotransferase